VFSTYRDVHFGPEHYPLLLPIVRQDLEALVTRMLADLDNVVAVLPHGVLGYALQALPDAVKVDEDGHEWSLSSAEDQVEVRDGSQDYYSIWSEHLETTRAVN
jgi:hypothetical protein